MSTLKVDNIRHNSATSDAITMASDGTCTAKLTSIGGGGLSHRNMIINGAMMISQRGTSSTGNLYQTIDRFRTSSGYIGSINLTQSQQQLTSSDTPYSSGFRYFYRAALSGAGTVNANGYIGISQRLEAQDVAQSGWDYTSSSSNITIQFWFRCSTNQTFYMALTSQDGTSQSYVFPFTATGNNTWTKITKTIPGAANVQFDLNNERGLTVSFTPWYGTDWTGSKAINQWSAYSGSAEYPDYASTWLTAGASTFDITGVQLEVGDTATSFEHRTYQEEILRCMRYYQQLTGNDRGYNGATGGSGSFKNPVIGIYNGPTDVRGIYYHMVPMRDEPSLTVLGALTDFDLEPFDRAPAAISMQRPGVFQSTLLIQDSGSATAGQACELTIDQAAGGLAFSAEL